MFYSELGGGSKRVTVILIVNGSKWKQQISVYQYISCMILFWKWKYKRGHIIVTFPYATGESKLEKTEKCYVKMQKIINQPKHHEILLMDDITHIVVSNKLKSWSIEGVCSFNYLRITTFFTIRIPISTVVHQGILEQSMFIKI